ncbi:MAG: anaerobic ribonucleoside-triphosphate reductase activating protein [Christensenellaceae bacterium]
MNYAKIRACDVANGEGVRTSLFVSVCRNHCKNCFNPETWDFSYGEPFTQECAEKILTYLAPDYISGFSLLGGEPFEPENQAPLAELLSRIKEAYPQKSVWCYTGYDLEKDLLSGRLGDRETVLKMLSRIDVLVDGRFVEELKDLNLRFRGSSNQRVIDVQRTLREGEIVLWEED